MFELFQSASDDQIALLGCLGALFGSGMLMYISYFIGPMARQEQGRQLDALIRHREAAFKPVAIEPVHDKAA